MPDKIKLVEIDPLVHKLEALIQSAVPTCAPYLANRIAACLVENGVVLLPIKLHDNIFIVEDDIVWHSQVESVEFLYGYDSGKPRIFCIDKDGFVFESDDIGRTVFLSESEATETLKD